MIYKTPKILPLLFPKYTWKIKTDEPKIFLTFDDGPIPEVTEAVLDILESYNAKASFFCIGDNVEKHPYIFEEIIKKGHAIGNHTQNHIKGWKYSDQDYIENIQMCQNSMNNYGFEQESKILFRPPYGRIKNSQGKKILDDYEIIMWSVLSQDYDNTINKECCLVNTIKATEKGSIVVFHDSLKAKKNMLYVLPKFLEYFSNLGYSFEKLGS